MSTQALYPYMRVRDCVAAIDFYSRVFGARELYRLVEPSGRVGHAELDFDGTVLMLSDPFPEMGLLAPPTAPETRAPLSIHLHVEDADAVIAKALAEGATLLRAAQDQFYGERSGAVRCPFGHEWLIGHALEEVTPEEMQRRYTALFD
ncbi:MAG: VOC family protein [Sandaracinaceae bacterium]|nr:VOC family protein [Sandaracinaceae bacterium]